ncbi:receptor-like protein 39 [Phragmites australis]|uniref:receptor-like protein 39 n=1 Tax=Phragmites australis TaxID=29695 RepID=UPI002D798C19|nr:receptor-like protein 39 [Phragmites australis]
MYVARVPSGDQLRTTPFAGSDEGKRISRPRMENQTSRLRLHDASLLLLIVHTSVAAAEAALGCPADQASALLRLKRSFQQPHLPSWRARTDCCRWEGVSCDAASGRVAALDLGGHGLQSHGGLDGSLFQLVTLRRLSLAGNDFGGASLPPSGFERLVELTHLNLSNADFAGQVPVGIGSLIKLVSLDLTSIQQLITPLEFKEPSFRAVMANLSNLRELHLDGVDMSAAARDWCDVLAESAPRLLVLTLQYCNLSGSIRPSFSRLRLLAVVDLSNNNQGFSDTSQEEVLALSGSIPEFFAEFHHLTILQLSNNNFNGSLPRGIFRLERLRVLDVSSNSYLSGSMPELPAGSSLEVLNLEETSFSGQIPSSINNLRHLKTLDISGSNGRFTGGIPASIGDLALLSLLDLSSSGFQIGELPAAIGRLQSLSTLRLRDCGISGAMPSWFENLRLLAELDLSLNNLSGPITSYREGSFLNLNRLQLCCNSLSGPVPGFIFSLPRLEFVSLMSNNLAGPLQEFSNPSPSLVTVYLKSNQLNGSIPMSFLKLQSLETLDLSKNSLSGTVQLSLFWKLTNLSNLGLSNNKLTVIVDDEHISSSGASPPPIHYLGLGCCNMTKIPSILRHVVVYDLDLSSNQIGGSIPNWIWAGQVENINVFMFNLSRNKFTDIDLPLANASIYFLDLSFNNLQGPIPIPNSPQFLDYSNNLFSSIPSYFMAQLSSAFFLNLANNTLHGGIPTMLCTAGNLKFLDLSYNYFSGHVPSCLVDGHLTVLKLRQNQLEGTLPDDIKGGCASQTIDLNGNQIAGKVPRSLSNCNDLQVFDVGNNNFDGSFPGWMMKLPKLRVLVLRSNRFSGPVSKVPTDGDENTTRSSSLQIIDLASNNFSGSLDSQWFENLKAMMVTSRNDSMLVLDNNLSGKLYRDIVVVTYKGTSLTISKILIAFTVIDFSDNAFTDGIPESIGRLVSLRGLNMSDNAFTGPIPSQLSDLKQLESLDLSSNQLDGKIPEVLTSLTSLAWLNVSYNHLQGSIPQGAQFSTFTNASFEGNAGLCGKPLSKQCNSSDTGTPSLNHEKSSDDRLQTIVLFCFVGSGFGLGFAMTILVQVVSICSGKRWSASCKHVLRCMIACSCTA